MDELSRSQGEREKDTYPNSDSTLTYMTTSKQFKSLVLLLFVSVLCCKNTHKHTNLHS